MAWNPQGGGQGPWGQGGSGGGPRPPDIEEILRRGQESFKKILPGGMGASRGLLLAVLAVAALWLGSGFYKVEPDELGVEMVFGEMKSTRPPGLNYNWPGPIGMVLKPKVTAINRIDVGYRSAGTGAGGRTQPTRIVTEESLMLTGDENIIDIRFAVFWKIDTRIPKEGGNSDNLQGVRNFLFNIRNPELTVKNAAESAMREIIGKGQFEDARTQGRTRMAGEAKDLIQVILDRYGAGIEVTSVQVQNVDPPANVIGAFRDVQVARADMERKVNEAEAYKNEVIQRSRGEAARIVFASEGYKQEKVSLATGEAQRFLSVYEQYKVEKGITRRRLYLETMKEVLKGMDKIIIDNSSGGSGVVPYLPLNELTRGQPAAAR